MLHLPLLRIFKSSFFVAVFNLLYTVLLASPGMWLCSLHIYVGKGGDLTCGYGMYLCLVFQPVVTSQMGTINNLIHVRKSDFEVFDALKVDSLESSETSCRGDFLVLLVSTSKMMVFPGFLSHTIFIFNRPFWLPSWNIWPRNVCLSTWGAFQVPAHSSSPSPPSHP